MVKLNSDWVIGNRENQRITMPPDGWAKLPEKVLQFGTGVLLRGLPDYFIDKANRQGVFNGRIVVVKSTANGRTDAFAEQDGLYTLHVKGIEGGGEKQETILVSAISRVLSAAQQWDEIMKVAAKPELEVVISNTTEVGIVLDEHDDLKAQPPRSFPGKLTAVLYSRFRHFNGDKSRGLVILPTELISNNGDKLKEIVLQLAEFHGLGADFMDWLKEANQFCDTLVDRIVPGKLPMAELEKVEEKLGYSDELAIMAEPFRLWAIAADHPEVARKLTFSQVDTGIAIAPDIWKFKELKLRLLNGSHTFSCGLAVLCGFTTVREAMQDADFSRYIKHLMEREIVPTIVGDKISEAEALDFATSVIDRFRNPFLDHQWLSIGLNYTSKMQMRNVALLEGYAQKQQPPTYMAMGFAAYLRFMRCKRSVDDTYRGNVGNGFYSINDEQAAYFESLWAKYDAETLVERVLNNQSLWHTNLSLIPGFASAVTGYLQDFLRAPALEVLRNSNPTA
ncbi:tagaturonate reductase [Parapedobacter tibetensis]|uniref:tagaturonate reductase n=1 Tax=Parapedobacter tibetensis TaxID=2972951 RepID=UPI00214D6CD8|nr:tagaturonate reductase [Parapedobacter tibetensis]